MLKINPQNGSNARRVSSTSWYIVSRRVFFCLKGWASLVISAFVGDPARGLTNLFIVYFLKEPRNTEMQINYGARIDAGGWGIWIWDVPVECRLRIYMMYVKNMLTESLEQIFSYE